MSFKISDEEKNALGMAPRVSLGVYASAEFNTSAVQTQYSASPDFDPNKRTLGFIMALKVNGAKAKQITGHFGVSPQFTSGGQGKATGEIKHSSGGFPDLANPQPARFNAPGDYDSLQGKDRFEALAKLRHSIWKKYLEFALAATYAQILPEKYKDFDKTYSLNSLFTRHVERDTSHVSWADFLKPEEKQEVLAGYQRISTTQQLEDKILLDKARELWEKKLVFQVKGLDLPPMKSAIDKGKYKGVEGVEANGLKKKGSTDSWLLAFEQDEQEDFLRVLGDVFGSFTYDRKTYEGKELGITVSGEIARINPETGKIKLEPALLVELFLDAATYSEAKILIIKNYTTSQVGGFTGSGSLYHDELANCRVIAFSTKTIVPGYNKTIGEKPLENKNTNRESPSPDFDEFKGAWWVFVHELIHANPLYANEYYDDEERQRKHLEYWAAQEINLDPDNETWKFLYEDQPKPGDEATRRKNWPSAWDPYSKEAITERTEAAKKQPPLDLSPKTAPITCTYQVQGVLSVKIPAEKIPSEAIVNQAQLPASITVNFEADKGVITHFDVFRTGTTGDRNLDSKLSDFVVNCLEFNQGGTNTGKGSITFTVSWKK